MGSTFYEVVVQVWQLRLVISCTVYKTLEVCRGGKCLHFLYYINQFILFVNLRLYTREVLRGEGGKLASVTHRVSVWEEPGKKVPCHSR